jgi:hypothetical protein
MLVVNGGYVIINLRYNQTIITIAQISFSLFKIMWNGVVTPTMFQWTKRVNERDFDEDGDEITEKKRNSFIETLFYYIVIAWNNILTPAFVTIIINPSCLYYAFVPSPLVDTSYSSKPICVNEVFFDSLNCVTILNSSKTLEPFIYNYQCTFAFLQSYAAAYTYFFILKSFFIPLSIIFLKNLSLYVYVHYENSKIFYESIVILLPIIIKPINFIVEIKNIAIICNTTTSNQTAIISVEASLNGCSTPAQTFELNVPASAAASGTD